MTRGNDQSTEKKDRRSQKEAGRQIYARSKITNGTSLLPDVDGRSIWARRFRDLMVLHIADKGGEDNCSEAEKALVRRAACLIVECERLEMRFAEQGGGKNYQLQTYQRLTNTLRRTLESIGLKREPRDVTPTLEQYLDQEAAE